MKKIQALTLSKMMLAALAISFMVAGIAQAQSDLPGFTGKFTLTTQVQWKTLVLQPGHYTFTIQNDTLPTLALVRDSSGRPLGLLMCQVVDRRTNAPDALLIRKKDGQFHVYSLSLGSAGRMLVYDPALAREAVLEARAPQSVPVMVAKR